MTDLDLETVRRKVRFFSTPEELRAWFLERHARDAEVWIGYPKKGCGRAGVTYAQAVDEALCFGWVDGQVRSLGPESYANRYTPRRPGSRWSQRNLQHIERLTREGRMHPAGQATFDRRNPRRAGYSFEERPRTLPPGLVREFRHDAAAWRYFDSQPPSYRRTSAFWEMSARQEATRRRRFTALLSASRDQRWIDLLSWGRQGGRPGPAPSAEVRPRPSPARRPRSRPRSQRST